MERAPPWLSVLAGAGAGFLLCCRRGQSPGHRRIQSRSLLPSGVAGVPGPTRALAVSPLRQEGPGSPHMLAQARGLLPLPKGPGVPSFAQQAPGLFHLPVKAEITDCVGADPTLYHRVCSTGLHSGGSVVLASAGACTESLPSTGRVPGLISRRSGAGVPFLSQEGPRSGHLLEQACGPQLCQEGQWSWTRVKLARGPLQPVGGAGVPALAGVGTGSPTSAR